MRLLLCWYAVQSALRAARGQAVLLLRVFLLLLYVYALIRSRIVSSHFSISNNNSISMVPVYSARIRTDLAYSSRCCCETIQVYLHHGSIELIPQIVLAGILNSRFRTMIMVCVLLPARYWQLDVLIIGRAGMSSSVSFHNGGTGEVHVDKESSTWYRTRSE